MWLAGRNEQRTREAVAKVVPDEGALASIDILVASTDDIVGLQKMAESCRVLLNVVGCATFPVF